MPENAKISKVPPPVPVPAHIIEKHLKNNLTLPESALLHKGEKTAGVTSGYVANCNGELYMVKSLENFVDPLSIGNIINEIVIAPFYTYFLYDRTATITLVKSNDKGTVMLRSKWLPNFETFKEFCERINNDVTTIQKVEGAEKLFAAILFCAEYDYHEKNIGVMSMPDGRMVYSKIDHDCSIMVLFTRVSKMLENLSNPFSPRDIINPAGWFGYHNKINLDLEKFRKAITQIVNISEAEIEQFVGARLDQLKKQTDIYLPIKLRFWIDDTIHHHTKHAAQEVIFTTHEELEKHYKNALKRQRVVMKGLAVWLEIIERIPHPDLQWKEGAWLSAIKGTNPIKWALDNGYPFQEEWLHPLRETLKKEIINGDTSVMWLLLKMIKEEFSTVWDWGKKEEWLETLREALKKAITEKDISVVRHLLKMIKEEFSTVWDWEKEPQLLVKIQDNPSVFLHLAAEVGDVGLVKSLLSAASKNKQALMEIKDEQGKTALLLAIEHEHYDVLMYMIEQLGQDTYFDLLTADSQGLVVKACAKKTSDSKDYKLAMVCAGIPKNEQMGFLQILCEHEESAFFSNVNEFIDALAQLRSKQQRMGFIKMLDKDKVFHLFSSLNVDVLTNLLKQYNEEDKMEIVEIFGVEKISSLFHNANEFVGFIKQFSEANEKRVIQMLKGNMETIIDDYVQLDIILKRPEQDYQSFFPIGEYLVVVSTLKNLPQEERKIFIKAFGTKIDLLKVTLPPSREGCKGEVIAWGFEQFYQILELLPEEDRGVLINALKTKIKKIIKNDEHLFKILKKLSVDDQKILIDILDHGIKDIIKTGKCFSLLLSVLKQEQRPALIEKVANRLSTDEHQQFKKFIREDCPNDAAVLISQFESCIQVYNEHYVQNKIYGWWTAANKVAYDTSTFSITFTIWVVDYMKALSSSSTNNEGKLIMCPVPNPTPFRNFPET